MRHARPNDVVDAHVPRSSFYDSPFGRMFGRLPPWVPAGADEAAKTQTLLDFANNHMVEVPGAMLDNSEIPAGYTYFGQFVDHDITFDPTSSVSRLNDPTKIKNFRTPRLDLDSLYGGGPEASPYLYESANFGRFILGVGRDVNGSATTEQDLPRNEAGTALIGDPRNDENLIVSQLQLAFLKLHNRLLDQIVGGSTGATASQFEHAQRITQWLYQYILWHDLVRRLVHDDIHADALELQDTRAGTSRVVRTYANRTTFYRWKQSPYIPVEFSVAAYRFGHSMVRPGYLVNQNIGLSQANELPIFQDPGNPSDDLAGGRALRKGFTVQWDWFFDLPSTGAQFPQLARKIDTRLAAAMSSIPMGNTTVPLAFLNLRRGWKMELPSGPDVADLLGIDQSDRPTVAVGTPEESLWFYVLAETVLAGGFSKKMLGPVGGTIVADVFAGLLKGDPMSYVNVKPTWTPADEPALVAILGAAPTNGSDWEVADILIAAGTHVTPPSATPDPIVFP